MQAIWRDTLLANSDATVILEKNHYFPLQAIDRTYFRVSTTRTTCPWKGQASYYDVVINGEVNKDAAWYYPDPKDGAKHIKDHIAFWKGVAVK